MNNRSRRIKPKFTEEKLCWDKGYKNVAGVDEVGRGCLAGPVVAAAVIMPDKKRLPWYKQVRDSKLLTPEQRELLSPAIHENAISIGTGVVSPDIIDSKGMTKAVQLAMKLALGQLSPPPEYVLIDYFTIPELHCPQKGVVEGDTLCFSIACASIVAKVFRDHLMAELDKRYPGYGLAQNKGYSTEEHIQYLHKKGPSPIHRLSFQPVSNAAQLSFEDFVSLKDDSE